MSNEKLRDVLIQKKPIYVTVYTYLCFFMIDISDNCLD